MTITVNTKAYGIDTFKDEDTAVYSGPAKTFAVEDQLVLKRGKSAAKQDVHNGYFRGEARFTRSFASTIDSKKRPGFVTVTWSLPSDAASTDVDSVRNDLGSLLSSSNGQDLFNKQDINQ